MTEKSGRSFFLAPKDIIGIILLTILLAVVLPLVLDSFRLQFVGKYLTYAFVALGLVLCWGYAGILSLGQGVFFGLGGYCMAMYLKLEASSVANTKIQSTPGIPDFMDWNQITELPLMWQPFNNLGLTILAVILVPALFAFIVGFAMFKRRVGGVYFAIITQALVYVAMLLMFRNDTGFGGNNGMTGFSHIFGVPMGTAGVATGLAVAALAVLIVLLIGLRLLVTSRFGQLVIACRDDEIRLKTLGYDTLSIKLALWCLSAVIAAIAGMLYVPQVGIINPRLLSPELSIEIAVWVAIGGRGHLVGAVAGAIFVNALKFWLATRAPELWPFILSGLVVLIVLALPNGFADLGTGFGRPGNGRGPLAALRRRFGSPT